jgi:hypothetical protein
MNKNAFFSVNPKKNPEWTLWTRVKSDRGI